MHKVAEWVWRGVLLAALVALLVMVAVYDNNPTVTVHVPRQPAPVVHVTVKPPVNHVNVHPFIRVKVLNRCDDEY